MAGHSHSANIKYRKDRQDSARSQLFLKLRRKIENIIREEGKITEEVLRMARENQFPKEKVYQIWERIKLSKERDSFSERTFYQAPFDILLYLENNVISEEQAKQLKLKKLPLTVFPNYFQLIYTLQLQSHEKNNLEEYLLTELPTDVWEKLNYDEAKKELTSSDKEIINIIKNIIEADKSKKLLIIEERKSWQALIIQPLSKKEEIDYYSQLEEKLSNKKFYTNVKNKN